MEDKYCTHDKSKKCVTVVVKEVVINIYIFFGWMGTFVVVFLITIGTVCALLSIYFFKDVVKLSALYCIIIAA